MTVRTQLWCGIVWEDGGVELFIWEEARRVMVGLWCGVVYLGGSQTRNLVVGSCSLGRVRRSFGRVIGTFTLFRDKVRSVTVVYNFLEVRYAIDLRGR